MPSLQHALDSWSWQSCARIKAKLFMMDDITDSATEMSWKCRLNMQMIWEFSQMERQRRNLFCIKGEKKITYAVELSGFGGYNDLANGCPSC